jgi:hypothetical protein
MSMKCNWELFELRVTVFVRGQKDQTSGNFSGQIGWEFFNVSINPRQFGLGDFVATADNQCNFKAVFEGLAKKKMIPFGFAAQRTQGNQLNFGNLQAAQRNGLTLRAAKLYVHRRDNSAWAGDPTRVGVLLEGVKVLFALTSSSGYYVLLVGDSANLLNF